MSLPNDIEKYNNILFENRLNTNIHRFNYKPVFISKKINKYYLEGVIKNYSLLLK